MSKAEFPTQLAEPGLDKDTGTEDFQIASRTIDASCRWPLMVFFSKGAGWLVLGTLLLLISSIKMHGPGLFADVPWLGYGRVRPAAFNALVYGFASQVGFGLLIWMLCRLGRTVLLNASLLFVAGVVWNVGVFLGVIGILVGASTGYQYFEMPRIAWPFIFVSLGTVALWGLITFHFRRERSIYVSQWYLVAALFWFPWTLSVAAYLLMFNKARGVMQAVVSAWYAQSVLGLWLTAVGLGAIFYFLPKHLGRALYSRQVAAFGFWTLALLGPLCGTARLSGGPVPNWLASTGIAATVVTLVPLLCAAINFHMTLEGQYKQARQDTVLRFILFGAAAYLLAGGLAILTAFRAVGQLTLFTFIPMSIDHLVLLGFFGMVAFGAIYDIMPRVTGQHWPSETLAKVHFNFSAGGLILYLAALLVGGLVQGLRLNNPEVEIVAAIKATIPFQGLATLGLMVFLAGQVAFLTNLQRLAWRVWEPLLKAICPFEAAKQQQLKAGVKS